MMERLIEKFLACVRPEDIEIISDEESVHLVEEPLLYRRWETQRVGWYAGLRTHQRLLGAGFEPLGSGHFSCVFAHPDSPELVFKFSFLNTDAYISYAMWCRQHPGDHRPEIMHIEKHGGGVLYVLPRYLDFAEDYADVSKADLKFMQHAAYEGAEEFREKYFSYIPKGVSHTLYDFVFELFDYFEGVAHIDINNDNYMYDPVRKQIIITDPVSFQE